MSSLVFEELPDYRKPPGSGRQAVVLAGLKARSGEWARLPTMSAGSASFYRARLGPEGFEFASRTVDGERRLYGRYVGTNGEHK